MNTCQDAQDEREYTEDDFRREGRWCDPGGNVQKRRPAQEDLER